MAATRAAGRSPGQTRGKRKLHFDPQPFIGKTIFLDLPGYKHAKELEQQLTTRGAVIEKFLDRKVRYLVTNRSKDEIRRSTFSSGQSPLTPSTGGNPNSYPSPSSNPARSVPTQACTTRAQKMLQMSLEKQQRSGGGPVTDVLAVASGWKCKILQVEDVEAELRKLKPVSVGDTRERKKAFKGGARVQKLRPPFFKVEDLSRQYRPIVYEVTQWPVPNLSCSPKSTPFDLPRDGVVKSAHEFEKDEKRPGYCECCAVRYEELEMHLKSAQHRQYATNHQNFQALDELIAQSTSFNEFVRQLKQSSEEERKETKATKRSPTRSKKSPSLGSHSPSKRLAKRLAEECPLPVYQPNKDDVVLISLPSTPGALTRGKAAATPIIKETAPEHTPGFSPLDSQKRPSRKRRLLDSPAPATKCSRRKVTDNSAKVASRERTSSGQSSSQRLAEEMALQEFMGSRRATRSSKKCRSLLQSAQTEELSYWQSKQPLRRSPRLSGGSESAA